MSDIVFAEVDDTLSAPVNLIGLGEVSLRDIQRPFTPENALDVAARTVGTGGMQKAPSLRFYVRTEPSTTELGASRT